MDVNERVHSFSCLVQYKICAYSSVHEPRWCADSWDTMELSGLPPMESLTKAPEPPR